MDRGFKKEHFPDQKNIWQGRQYARARGEEVRAHRLHADGDISSDNSGLVTNNLFLAYCATLQSCAQYVNLFLNLIFQVHAYCQ